MPALGQAVSGDLGMQGPGQKADHDVGRPDGGGQRDAVADVQLSCPAVGVPGDDGRGFVGLPVGQDD